MESLVWQARAVRFSATFCPSTVARIAERMAPRSVREGTGV